MGLGRLLELGLDGDVQETYIHGNAFVLLCVYVASVLPYWLDLPGFTSGLVEIFTWKKKISGVPLLAVTVVDGGTWWWWAVTVSGGKRIDKPIMAL